MSDVSPPPCPPSIAATSALLAEFEAAAIARRNADLRCARALAKLGESRGWESIGCASVGEFGERHAIPAAQTRALLDLGRALGTSPILEQQLLAGKVSVEAASYVAPVLARIDMLRPDDDWIGWAQTETTKALRDRVRRRQEEFRIGDEPACAVTVHVRSKSRDDFGRARAVASRRAGRALTYGETFETVVDHYLNEFDEDRVAPGKRRSPPTALVDGRYVPMAVRREIFERQGHECAVPFCGHTMFLEKAHLWAHASGGDREAENLVLLCSTHHWFLDSGWIKLVGTAAKPRFFDSLGVDMATRYEPGGSQSPFRSPTPEEMRSRSGPPPRIADPSDSRPPIEGDPPPRQTTGSEDRGHA